MRSAHTLTLALAAGIAAGLAPAASAQHTVLTDATQPVDGARYVYINARTGERTITSTPLVTRSEMIPRFVNEDAASNGNGFWAADNPAAVFPTTVGGGQRIGGEVSSSGDIEFDSTVDFFTAAYATGIAADSPGDTVDGLSMTIWWYNCDNGFNDSNAVPLWSVTIEDLVGNDGSGINAAIYMVDLDGSGLEFEIGDTDGSFVGSTGEHSTGCGTGRADFSWSYRFHQEQAGPLGIIGPVLVLPASSLGVPDALDFYKNPTGGNHELYAATYFFGGWPAAPYASTYMGLYGSNPRDCGPADFNADTTVDVLDFLDFIDDFSNCENRPAPCGTIANTDLGGDTIVDILDFLDFMDVFAACE